MHFKPCAIIEFLTHIYEQLIQKPIKFTSNKFRLRIYNVLKIVVNNFLNVKLYIVVIDRITFITKYTSQSCTHLL